MMRRRRLRIARRRLLTVSISLNLLRSLLSSSSAFVFPLAAGEPYFCTWSRSRSPRVATAATATSEGKAGRCYDYWKRRRGCTATGWALVPLLYPSAFSPRPPPRCRRRTRPALLRLLGRRCDNGGAAAGSRGRRDNPIYEPSSAQGGTARSSLPSREGEEPALPPDTGGSDDTIAPPKYDGSALAREAFADPFFYAGDKAVAAGLGAQRNGTLGGLTVREAYQAYFRRRNLGAIQALAADLDAYDYCVAAYFRGERTPIRQDFAAKALVSAFHCNFKVAVIPMRTIHEALLPLLRAKATVDGDAGAAAAAAAGSSSSRSLQSRTIDMSFLNPLRVPGMEKFLVPDKIYVRDCMRRVFRLFHEDAVQVPRRVPYKAYSVALIGSPGVGKSILFFLAAIDQARNSSVVYYRRKGEDSVSVFVMTPDYSSGESVRVWYSRNVQNLSNEGLKDLRNALTSTCAIDSKGFYTFIDGPKHFDLPNLLDGDFEYLCTSGGFPPYHNSEQDKRLWILDGWSEEEAIQFLDGVRHSGGEATTAGSERARNAYWLCGGNIRDMLEAWENKLNVESALSAQVKLLDSGMVQLAISSTERGNFDAKNPDRIRTMFWERSGPQNAKYRMNDFQVVDSGYVLNYLRRKLDMGKLFEAYALVKNSNLQRGAEGAFFELMIHRLVDASCNLKDNDPERISNVKLVRWSDAKTWRDDMAYLRESSAYWVPNVSNFPSIDSAIVLDKTLFAFQMRITSKPKPFIFERFQEFQDHLRAKESLSALNRRAVVTFVRPTGTTSVVVPPDSAEIEFRSSVLDDSSLAAFSSSVRRMLESLRV